MNLDLVLGISCANPRSLTCDCTSRLLAYPASGVLVLLDTGTNCQVSYLHLRKNSFSSADFSSDGKYLVTGEVGYKPAVRVWRVKDGQEVATMYGHEFGIKSVLFCPTMDTISSVGLEHDNEVNVWAWPSMDKVATNKIVDVINAAAYSECGNYFVTAGTRHLKYWYPNVRLTKTTVPVVTPLYGRSGILGHYKNNTFVDVCCGNGASKEFVFTVTKSGSLVIVNSFDRRILGHRIIEQCQITCLKVQDQILFMGFSDGVVHMFDSMSLSYLATLPIPTFVQRTNIDDGGIYAIVFNPAYTILTAVFKNAKMCVWDLSDSSDIKQKYAAVYHNKGITDLDLISSRDEQGNMKETLVTVSQDSTIRLWGLCSANTAYNAICYDSLNILYTNINAPAPLGNNDTTLTNNAGFITVVKVSPDQEHIVTGTSSGSICVYKGLTYEHVLTVVAHNRDITCLAFYANRHGCKTLVSGGRDRLIHVMDVNRGYRLVSTLNIHSSSITAICLCETENSVYLLSCAADRTLNISITPVPLPASGICMPVFHLFKSATVLSTPSDIALDTRGKQLVVACQDGHIRTLQLDMLQEKRTFRGCRSDDGQINKIHLDADGILLLTAASDKTINVINFISEEVLVTVTGHTKPVTGLTFTSSGEYMISASMDGCLFVWRLSEKLKLVKVMTAQDLEETTFHVVHDSLANKKLSDKWPTSNVSNNKRDSTQAPTHQAPVKYDHDPKNHKESSILASEYTTAEQMHASHADELVPKIIKQNSGVNVTDLDSENGKALVQSVITKGTLHESNSGEKVKTSQQEPNDTLRSTKNGESVTENRQGLPVDCLLPLPSVAECGRDLEPVSSSELIQVTAAIDSSCPAQNSSQSTMLEFVSDVAQALDAQQHSDNEEQSNPNTDLSQFTAQT